MSENSPYCGSEPCPVLLSSSCVFYKGQDLIYIGVNTNDPLQTVIEKINQAFQNSGVGYAFTNGIVQPTPFDPVQLGGSLIQNTTIGGNYTLTFIGELQAARHITTGGTASQFVKGDGSLDSTSYQPVGNYLTALSGDGTASGPGSAVFTLTTVNFAPGTFGSGSNVPVVTVDAKGRVTNLTSTPLVVPPQSLTFIGDVVGSGLTGTAVTLSLQNINANVYNTDTALKFSVNSKGLVTSATPLTGTDIDSIVGYTVGNLLSTGSYANPSWITSLAWSKIISSPTTLSGYGITDALDTSIISQVKLGGLTALNFIKSGGTSVQFLKADGSVDSTAYAPINNPVFTGSVTLPGSPMNPLEAATKQYVDDVSQGLDIHAPCVAATTTNLVATYINGVSGLGATLTNNGAQAALVIDGVTLSLNNRVLVKNQSSQLQNGIYTVTNVGSGSTNWVLTRATDYDQTAEINGDDFVFISSGLTNNNTGWVQTQTSVVIGVSNILFVQFSGAGTYQAGNGLTLSGNIFSINTAVTVDLNTAQVLTNKTITGSFTGNLSGNASTVTNGVYTTGSYSDPTWITGLAWSKILSTPTTLSGYGITDAYTQTQVNTLLSGYQPLLTNPVTGTGTSGQVAFWNGTTSQTGSNNLFWDNANGRLGIGTNSPLNRFHISFTTNTASSMQDSTSDVFISKNDISSFYFSISSDTPAFRGIFGGLRSRGTLASPTAVQSGDLISTFLSGAFDGTQIQRSAGLFFDAESNASAGSAPQLINLVTGSTSANRTTKLQVRSNGNVIIQNGGTFTDAGFRLDVAGSTRIVPPANTTGLTLSGYSLTGSDATSAVNISGTWNTTGTPTLILANVTNTASNASSNLMDLQVGGVSRFLVRASDGRILLNNTLSGIRASSNTLILNSNVVGTTPADDFNFGSGQGPNSATSGISSVIITRVGTTQAFNPTSGTGVFNIINIPTTINQTGGANGITRGLYVNPTLTSAADWRSIEFSNNTGWGLYGTGTAPNYLNGSLGIGTTSVDTTSAYNLRVSRQFSGGTVGRGIVSDSQITSGPSTIIYYSAFPTASATASVTNLRNFYVAQGTFTAGSTITSQSGFQVDSSMVGATFNYAFLGGIPSGTNRWNLYMDGTASNYLRGNLLLNTTTDAGFLLDVNGTARVTGNLTTNLTATRIPFIGTGGVLSDDAGLTWDNTNKFLTLTRTSAGASANTLLLVNNSANASTEVGIRFAPTSNFTIRYAEISGVNEGNNQIALAFITGQAGTITEKWRINPAGILQSNGAQTIQTSTGNLTIATNGGNGNIALLPNGTGGVGVGTSSPNAVAQLEVSSTTKGFLPPRMTTAQRDLIAAVAGLVIYNTTTNKHQGHNGTAWQDFY